VLFARTTDLVQKLQSARQELSLAATIEKLDKYDLLILDDLSYVQKNQAETSVPFELIAARYERRSMLITANQPFGAWDSVFPNKAMTVVAIDRLVHHAVIFELNVESYRRKAALARSRLHASQSRPRSRKQSTPRVNYPEPLSCAVSKSTMTASRSFSASRLRMDPPAYAHLSNRELVTLYKRWSNGRSVGSTEQDTSRKTSRPPSTPRRHGSSSPILLTRRTKTPAIFDALRVDPAFKLACGRLLDTGANPVGGLPDRRYRTFSAAC
jgi:hypothetical protein